jgi:hypothetical protein
VSKIRAQQSHQFQRARCATLHLTFLNNEMDCSLRTEASPFELRGKTAVPFERLMWCAAPAAGCAAKIPPPTDKDLLCRSHRPPFPRLFACYTYSSSRPRTQTNRLLFNLARSSTHTHLRGYNFAIQIQHHQGRARWSLFTLPTAQSTLSPLALLPRGSNLRLGATAGRERNQTPLSEPPSHTHFC